MKTLTITEAFTGYPAGKKREFRAGEEVEVANDFAEMLVNKGLAKEAGAKPSPKPAPVETAPEKDDAK